MHGKHAEKNYYLRSLIVPQCAEVIVPLTIAVSENFAAWHGSTGSREARLSREHLHKGLWVAHNVLASLVDVNDPPEQKNLRQ